MVSLVLSNTKWIYGRILQNRLIACMSCTTYNTSTTKSKKMGTLSSQKGNSSEETNQFYKCHVLSKWKKTIWLQKSLHVLNVYITVMDIIWRARPGSWFNSSLKLLSTSPICFSMYSFEVCQKHRTSIYFHQKSRGEDLLYCLYNLPCECNQKTICIVNMSTSNKSETKNN